MPDSLQQLSSSQLPGYIKVFVEVSEVLKGVVQTHPLPVQYYTGNVLYEVSNEKLIQSFDEPKVIFLAEKNQAYYFSQIGDGAILAKQEIQMTALKEEILKQENILINWAPNKNVPHYHRVEALIHEMKESITAPSAFKKLEELGMEAVPAIIVQMDNHHQLPEVILALENKSPDAFEAYRQYGPVLVVDALAAILNQITGEHFGTIYNGGTEDERSRTVSAWKIYGMRDPAFVDARPSIGE
ncbi:MAG: hypothetical protein DHS20C05_02040 [Hyphococcus sp.]|nr:MAG: hypothetical protein DHS20C05_02040 [Marinicaulis sp.]